jgi:plasmid stabilization system protein ParE
MTSRRLRSTNADRADLADIWYFVARLIDYPEAGSKREAFGQGIRALVVDRYLTFYRIAPDGVLVLRIFDGRRDIRAEDLDVG